MKVIGIVAFATSGAVAEARAGMDWLGVSTLAAVTAIGGGTLRDILMNETLAVTAKVAHQPAATQKPWSTLSMKLPPGSWILTEIERASAVRCRR